MLFRDLIERYKVPNVSILKYYCKRIVSTSAGEFSINKIYNELKSQGYKVGKDTLYSFQNYVESIYLGCFINKWSTSVVKSESAQKKCYVIDQGLGSALDYKFSQDIGRLLETTVALELIKQGKEITYQQEVGECDFIISNKGKVETAIQVCMDITGDITQEREIRGLVQSCKRHELQNGVLITLDQMTEIEQDGVKIFVIPAWRYFYT
jgi:predicted AAA+ superfamily ATPase